MAIYPVGVVIKRRREERGISQEALAEGICSVATLSRLENGVRFPSRTNFMALMERLGYGSESSSIFASEEELDIHELQFRIRQAAIHRRYDVMNQLLDKMEQDMKRQNADPICEQFYRFERIICKDKAEITARDVPELEDILKITVPRYGKVPLKKLFLTYEELSVLNGIAVGYASGDNYEKGIGLFYEIRDYMREKIINSEERMRLYPAILYNLSKYLGLSGRYEECIRVCNDSIHELSEYKRTQYLHKLCYNKAWCMSKISATEHRQEINKLMLQAYYSAQMTECYNDAALYEKFINEHCQELLPTLY